MSRRAAVVEEFDDDTDLPLPSRPLPNTGTRGAILEEIGASSDEDDARPGASASGPASPAFAKAPAFGGPQHLTDPTPFKTWTCIYPIYLDAKAAYGAGRRVARVHALWWPLSADIARAATRLGVRCVHELDKRHPRDWANPGRVRVTWKRDDGKPLNPQITTKKKLIEAIGKAIQIDKPDLIPREPYGYTTPTFAPSAPAAPVDKKAKGKAALPAPAAAAAPTADGQKPNGRTAQPPGPAPTLAQRFSPYSPTVPAGILVDTIKAGMAAQESAAPPALPGAAQQAAMGKGKKKVIRVRA